MQAVGVVWVPVRTALRSTVAANLGATGVFGFDSSENSIDRG
jgi:hypothetical protein